jgi:hypothetical protein
MRALRENQHISKSFKPFQTKPSESKANILSNVAAPVNASSSVPVIHSVNDAEDSEATPTPSPPPPKFVSLVGQNLLNLEPSPEEDQTKPSSPTPEADQTKPPSPPPEGETLTSPEPKNSPEPNQQQKPNSDTADKNLTDETIEKSQHHVVVDNTFTVIHPNNSQFQELS